MSNPSDRAQCTPPISTPIPDQPLGAPAGGHLYVPTDASPEQVCQAIGRLRKEARDEIDRLVRFLDDTENHMEREPEDEADESELESSLGSFDRIVDQSKAWKQCGEFCSGDDSEQDEADMEDNDPPEDGDTGIGDQDGLHEQVPIRD
jgi:hypothetical protein